MGFTLSILLGIIPMLFFAWFVYWMDRYEKEPKSLLGGVFVWGAVVAAGGAYFVNTLLGAGVYLFTGSEVTTELTTGSLIAPVVEESLKGFAVLAIFLAFRNEFDSLMDGVVYAAVTALGFAATENAYYIYQYGFQESGMEGLLWMAFVRVILVGWQHPFYTAFIGIGLATSHLSRNQFLKVAALLIGWSAAVFTHSAHNTIATLASGLSGLVFGTFLDWTGWSFMFLFIVWALNRERKWLTHHLHEEMVSGLITPKQYLTACSAWSQSGARLAALFEGRYHLTARFYQTCAELAHKKQRYAALGDEIGACALIERLRADLADLSLKLS